MVRGKFRNIKIPVLNHSAVAVKKKKGSFFFVMLSELLVPDFCLVFRCELPEKILIFHSALHDKNQ